MIERPRKAGAMAHTTAGSPRPALHPAVLFLDFDGVINTVRQMGRVRSPRRLTKKEKATAAAIRQTLPLHTDHLTAWELRTLRGELVRAVSDALVPMGASIVVSSTWRIGHNTVSLGILLAALGNKAPVIDVTADLSPHRTRGDEIQKWLSENGVCSFAILDDCEDMGHLAHRLVRTDSARGVTADDLRQVRELLERPLCPARWRAQPGPVRPEIGMR